MAVSFTRLLPLAALSLLAAACSVAPSSAPASRPTAPPSSPAAAATSAAAQPGQGSGKLQLGGLTFNDRGTRDVKGMDQVKLEADDFYFKSTFLRANPGQKLKLQIENEGKVQHNFSLSEQQIDKDIPPKGAAEIEVALPQSGVLRFFCKFHASQGMNGELLAGEAVPESQPATPTRGSRY